MLQTVDIEPGLLTVTPENGLPVVVNGQNVVTEGGVLSIRKQGTLVSVSTPTGYVDVLQYKVILDLTNFRQEVIWMGSVTNHLDWTNDEAGTELATEEIKVALQQSGGGGGGVSSFSFSDGNGFDGTVTNPGTTPQLTLTTTVADNQVMVSDNGAISGVPDGTAGQVLTSQGPGVAPGYSGRGLNFLEGVQQGGVYVLGGSTSGGNGRVTLDLTAATPPMTSAYFISGYSTEGEIVFAVPFLLDPSAFSVGFYDTSGVPVADGFEMRIVYGGIPA